MAVSELDVTPTLSDADLKAVEQLGEHRTVEAGTYLYRAGDSSADFYVVVSGTVDLLGDCSSSVGSSRR